MSCKTRMPAKKMSNYYPLKGGAFAVSSRWAGALPDSQVLANVGLGSWRQQVNWYSNLQGYFRPKRSNSLQKP